MLLLAIQFFERVAGHLFKYHFAREPFAPGSCHALILGPTLQGLPSANLVVDHNFPVTGFLSTCINICKERKWGEILHVLRYTSGRMSLREFRLSIFTSFLGVASNLTL